MIPNKFPALCIEDRPERHVDDCDFKYMPGCGAHEVIIESPDHDSVFAKQSMDQIERVLTTLQLRYRDLMRDSRFQTVIIFKNHGVEAGTSLAHPHWQLIATPVVPRLLRLRHIEASEFYDRTGACVYCDLTERELKSTARILVRDNHFVALLPYASHSPFETWILPLEHQASYLLASGPQLRSLAKVMKQVLLKLHTSLNNPAFNLTLNDVPRGDEDQPYFHWHMRILPRLTTPAGFELGSGMSINTVVPEEATRFLNESPIAALE